MVAGESTQSGRVVGTDGVLDLRGPFVPQAGHELAVVTSAGRRVETVPSEPTSYAAQLTAFVDAALRGEPFPTNPDDSVATMRVVDACYRAAGLEPRRPTVVGTAGAG
jgi:predicted dehydrogenase